MIYLYIQRSRYIRHGIIRGTVRIPERVRNVSPVTAWQNWKHITLCVVSFRGANGAAVACDHQFGDEGVETGRRAWCSVGSYRRWAGRGCWRCSSMIEGWRQESRSACRFLWRKRLLLQGQRTGILRCIAGWDYGDGMVELAIQAASKGKPISREHLSVNNISRRLPHPLSRWIVSITIPFDIFSQWVAWREEARRPYSGRKCTKGDTNDGGVECVSFVRRFLESNFFLLTKLTAITRDSIAREKLTKGASPFCEDLNLVANQRHLHLNANEATPC